MKLLDAALLSAALGLSGLTLYLFGSDYPAGFVSVLQPAPTAPSVPRSREFRSLVLHGFHPGCRASDPGSLDTRAHFLVPVEDARGVLSVRATSRWKEQIPAAHTRNVAFNRQSVAIWVEQAGPAEGPTPLQREALADLVRRLRAEYGIPAGRVYSHADVDLGCRCGLPATTSLR